MKRITFRSTKRSTRFSMFAVSLILLILSFSFTGELFSQSAVIRASKDEGSVSPKKTGFVAAVDRAYKSVVSIQGEKQSDSSDGYLANRSSNSQENVTHIGMGTGVIVDERGYIITNFHVVKGLLKIQITTYDGTVYRNVEFIRNDLSTDLALLKIDPTNNLQKVAFGRSEDVSLAEDVVAIGNPFGYQASVSRGIVSGLKRPLQANETLVYEDVIQTDAAINPGNSGGPLINIKGEMIGLNAAVREGAENIAFAIPVNTVAKVAEKMIREAVTKFPETGVSLQQVELNDDGEQGRTVARCIIDKLDPASPAARSGLQKGDFLLQANKSDIHSPIDFTCSLIGLEQTDPINVLVSRNGRQLELALKLNDGNRAEIQVHAARPASGERAETKAVYAEKTAAENEETVNEIVLNDSNKEEFLWQRFGIQIEPISDQKFKELHPNLLSIPMGKNKIHPAGAVRVTAVSEASLFQTRSERLEKGDLIFGFVIGNSEDYRWGVTTLNDCCYIADVWGRLAEKNPENKKARLYLIRKGNAYFFDIER